MAIKITNQELVTIRNAGQMYITRNPERSRLHYAIEKFLKKTQSKFEDYQDKENDLRVDHALVDKDTKKFVLDETKNIAIDPTKAKDFNSKMRQLSREEIEVEPYFATEVPKELEAIWFQVFNGILINDSEDPMSKPAVSKAAKEVSLELTPSE